MLSASVEADLIPTAACSALVVTRVNLEVAGIEPATQEVTVSITPRPDAPEAVALPD
ncbi:MAG: hypothetical protein LC104_17380 [Bacteroidales bacterium]|nr:hypothetical protein [Bacteroidales bacterium]